MKFDSFTFNMIAGATLATILVVLGLKEIGGLIYHAPKPEKPGMAVEIADSTAGAETKADDKAETVSLAALMAKADAAKGQKGAKKCVACHTFDDGGKNKVGPNLWNIVAAKIGVKEGFKYSSAMAGKSAESWSYEALDAFLKKPKEYLPGTKMGFAGMKKASDRADMIAYLRSLSASPQPLPTE